jgi:hypothetical protein
VWVNKPVGDAVFLLEWSKSMWSRTFLKPLSPGQKIAPPPTKSKPSAPGKKKAKKSTNARCPCGNLPKRGSKYCRPCGKTGGPRTVTRNSRTQIIAGKTDKRKFGRVYSKRNAICRDLGYNSYEGYTRGSLWKKIRQKVFVECGSVCIKCGDTAFQIHHSEYTRANLSGVSVEGLHPVCGSCHYAAEFDESGRKNTLAEANERLGILASIQARHKT